MSIYQYPYGAPDMETERRVKLEHAIDQDQEQHFKDDCAFNRIVNNHLVPCAWDDLDESEKRAVFANLFRLY